MIVLGDISGIQTYLFDVAEEGGGQAQRLRARSFFVQLLAETAALRLLCALEWGLDSIRLSGAGKFLLRGTALPNVDPVLDAEQQAINGWLLRETRGELRLTLAWADSDELDTTAYNMAQEQLQQKKARPWAPVQGASWDIVRLILDPLDTPCSLCGHAPAQDEETDRDTDQVRRVCLTCAANRRLGRCLPQARWLIIRVTRVSSDFEMFGLGVSVLMEDQGSTPVDTVAVANLREPETPPSWCPQDRFLQRRLTAHVPTDGTGQPVWFTELARHAQGDQLLAVLKADADSLGVRFQELLDTGGLEAMAGLSEQLDAFFAGRLRHELADNREGRWRSIYTIFAGGDDLVMVGPWDVMVDFAGQMRDWFMQEFHNHGLTISAGLALIKPKRPIKPAVAEAERLLEEAKTRIVPGESAPKDQCAAFGQIWKWKNHTTILTTARQLCTWIDDGQIQRGWLHTLLELVEARHGTNANLLATSRLAYHVERNYRRGSDAKRWAECLVERFDNPSHVAVRYLPAIARYALTATRNVSGPE